MLKDISVSAVFMGALAALVGYGAAFAVVLQGLRGVGATEAQAATGLMAVSIAMGLAGMVLSLWRREPLTVAWSTPGAALLASSAAPAGGFAEAVGAFLICGALLTAAGLWRPLARAVAAIPGPIASAMLAGVLLSLCLAPAKAVAVDPTMGLPIVIAWAVGGRIHKLLAVPAALVAFAGVLFLVADVSLSEAAEAVADPTPDFTLVSPVFTLSSAIGVAAPLFLVTMAGQNIPGVAVLKSFGYDSKPGAPFAVTGAFSFLFAPLGGHAVNLAAITAALCAGEDAHPDKARRYWAAATMGAVSVALGLLTGAAVSFVSLAPTILIEAVAGLALISAFAAASLNAFSDPKDREAAAVTLLVTASGLNFFGISGAFWGLLAGLALYALQRIARPRASS